MKETYGYTGKILWVNLSKPEFLFQDEDPALMRQYVGGVGLGAKILYDEVKSGTKWSDPENCLILASGPLAGTTVKGSGNFSVVTKGAMTEGGATSTQASGFLGAYLKFAGCDAVVIDGRAKQLSYLFIHDGKAELRDARHLAGKDTWEIQDLIKQELGFNQPGMSVFGIGPAGENMVRFAALVGDGGHVAGHNGVGAVMGSKNLKAVAIARGKGTVNVFDRPRLTEAGNKMLETIKNDRRWSNNVLWGTLHLNEGGPAAGSMLIKNYTTNECLLTEEQLQTFSAKYLREHITTVKRHPCWACQFHHCDIIRIPEGPYAGCEGEEPEHEGYASMGAQIGNYDGIAATALANEVDRLGMDTNETGWVLGMVMEGYEKGLLTRQDTDGLEMTWGNVASARAMMNNIARRQGMGDVLAEGVMRASQHLGRGLTEMAVHSKTGNTPVSHDHRHNWRLLFDVSVANTGSTELHLMPRAAAIGTSESSDQFSPEETASMVAHLKAVTAFVDCLGICRQANREVPEILTEMVKAATGWADFTWAEGLKAGSRAYNILRAFNIRHGYDTRLESPSPRYGSTPASGPGKDKSIMPTLDKMLDIYYGEMGWERASGKPLPETLRKLGLESIIADLWSDKG